MNRIVLMCLRNFWRVPYLYFKLCKYARHPERYSREEMYEHIKYIFTLAVKSGNIDLTVNGTENIPEDGGFLMYANHQGLFDILALCVTQEKPWAAVLKKELNKIPVLKQMVACTNSFPMDREDVRASMKVIQSVIDDVNNGKRYLIFPEGTRSRNGNEMLEFHGGSFKCALKTKAPVVPIALIDCFKVLDQKGSKPVAVQIHYLPPIYYDEYKDMKTGELANFVRSRIQEKIWEIVEEK